MTVVAKGQVGDRPLGQTLYAIAAKSFTGVLTFDDGKKQYVLRWMGGKVVGADSADPDDRLEDVDDLPDHQRTALLERAFRMRAVRCLALKDASFTLEQRDDVPSDVSGVALGYEWLLYQSRRLHSSNDEMESELAEMASCTFRFTGNPDEVATICGMEPEAKELLVHLRARPHAMSDTVASAPRLDRSHRLAIVSTLRALRLLEAVPEPATPPPARPFATAAALSDGKRRCDRCRVLMASQELPSGERVCTRCADGASTRGPSYRVPAMAAAAILLVVGLVVFGGSSSRSGSGDDGTTESETTAGGSESTPETAKRAIRSRRFAAAPPPPSVPRDLKITVPNVDPFHGSARAEQRRKAARRRAVLKAARANSPRRARRMFIKNFARTLCREFRRCNTKIRGCSRGSYSCCVRTATKRMCDDLGDCQKLVVDPANLGQCRADIRQLGCSAIADVSLPQSCRQ